MAEIFLGYFLSFLDVIYKVAVVAFVLRQFRDFLGFPVTQTVKNDRSPGDTSQPNPPAGENPFGDLIKGVFAQATPMLKEMMAKPVSKGPKKSRTFEDDGEAVQTPEVQNVTPTEVTN